MQPSLDLEDKTLWMDEKNGLFSVKSLFKVLEEHLPSFSFPVFSAGTIVLLFPANTIWKPKIQPRICFFASEAAWGKVLTLLFFSFFLESIGSFNIRLGKLWKDGGVFCGQKEKGGLEGWAFMSFFDCLEGEK